MGERLNVALTWLVSPPLRDFFCRKRPYGWPWWCEEELQAARERAVRHLRRVAAAHAEGGDDD